MKFSRPPEEYSAHFWTKWSFRQRSSVILWKATTITNLSVFKICSLNHQVLDCFNSFGFISTEKHDSFIYLFIYFFFLHWDHANFNAFDKPDKQAKVVVNQFVLTLCMHDRLHRDAAHTCTHTHPRDKYQYCLCNYYIHQLTFYCCLFVATENKESG